MPNPITYRRLKKLGACQKQLAVFKEVFGDEAPLTVEAAVTNADKFDWDWAAEQFLSQPAREAYWKAVITIQKAYDEAIAIAFAELYLSEENGDD